MNRSFLQLIRPSLLIFIFISAFAITGKSFLVKKNIDQDVLLAGNLVLFLATLGSLFIFWKGFTSSNPQSSVRSMYGSFMIKFFVIIIAAFAYIMLAKKNVNKPALIACAGLYIVYTYIEVAVLTRTLKQKKNA